MSFFTSSFRRTPESRVAGGRPAAGYFRLRGQKKVAKEKAAPGSPPLAWCPCAARQARRLWNSLSNLNEHIERADSSDSPRRQPLPCLRLLGVSQGVLKASSVAVQARVLLQTFEVPACSCFAQQQYPKLQFTTPLVRGTPCETPSNTGEFGAVVEDMFELATHMCFLILRASSTDPELVE